jgi:hypothetical protein
MLFIYVHEIGNKNSKTLGKLKLNSKMSEQNKAEKTGKKLE